ncbi:Nucleolar GTPase [Spironucleus salmonicida]|uniref:Nucleolar GTPase n=1 Tax=Spironucleus salmonicida TaxID=348837 RepID=V6M5Z4_9EUKA|nr:Nucleolar GTPase [Spironucleus salmonicida]|eukprot:EST48779.1 Nucleolar GTPase [Spironucleus salmonicida]
MPKKQHKSKRRASLKEVRAEKRHQSDVRRKTNKDVKKGKAPRKILLKDPALPNIDPLKAKIMRQLLNNAEKITPTDMQRAMAQKFAVDVVNAEQEIRDIQDDIFNSGDVFLKEKNLRKQQFKTELNQVVQQSDVILQVLDARDPENTRNGELEQLCRTLKKPFVLLLNKIDLVPSNVIQQYVNYYKSLHIPSILFKAPQIVGKSSVRYASAQTGLSDKTACVGAFELKRLLHSLCPGERAVACCVGYPNTGKSSVINALANRACCLAAPIPGQTRNIKEIHIDKKLRLLDCPGVVFDTRQNVILREELLEDPIGEVGRLLGMVGKISDVYNVYTLEFQELDPESQLRDFLVKLGKKLGKIKHGGIVDQDEVAISVVRDWNRGVIPFWRDISSVQNIQQVQEAFIQGIDGDMLEKFNYDVIGHLAGIKSGVALK